jgi:hypothetical protein
MLCADAGARVTCSYGNQGRIDCVKEAEGALLTCTFSAPPPNAETGHVLFTRDSPAATLWRGQMYHDGPRMYEGPQVWNAQRLP